MPEQNPKQHPVPGYRLYVDESGDHTYKKLEEPWHKHLALVGVWLRRGDEYEVFTARLEKMKRDIFGVGSDDEPVILHRSEIKGRQGIYGVLNDPDKDRAFCASLLEIVSTTPFTMVSVIIDKAAHKAKYAVPIHPYHFAMTALVERYAFWLRERANCGDAMIEARGKNEDQQLEAVYRKVATAGTWYLKSAVARKVLTSKELKVRPKTSNIAGLQLADLLAHPIKMEALVEKELCKPHGGFARELAAAARPKYRDCYGGVVTGRGRVWM